MKKVREYTLLLSRDFTFPSVQAWVNGEVESMKQWASNPKILLPYIIAERADDTVHFHYDLGGPVSLPDTLIRSAHEDKNFIEKISKTVLDNVSFIKSIYEKERAVDLDTFKKFLKGLEEAYGYCNPMWLLSDMGEEKLKGLNLESLNKVRRITEKLCDSSDVVIRKSLLKNYSSLGELSTVLLTSEIFAKSLPGKKELEKRYEGYFYTDKQMFSGVGQGFIVKKFNVRFKKVVSRKTKKLRGNIAQIGFAKGFVRRVMGHDQISYVKEGEILVSPMTIPDFLPAMKKASAFVTDEGGILCHAAIVARELRKPCIVGTEIATKVLKDGDFVEVDANKGVVRILKRS